MARINYNDCKYYIYCHYNDYHDLDNLHISSVLKKYQVSRFNKKECGFITGARDSIELDYIVRQLDQCRNIDYVILEQMSLLDYDG